MKNCLPKKALIADHLLGRRFEFQEHLHLPDVTCVAVDPEQQRIRLHARDGGRWWIPMRDIERAFKTGTIQESERAPFIL
jgi:hypothetical protein